MKHRTTYPGEIITDDMTADEIIAVLISDFDKNFSISFDNRVTNVRRNLSRYLRKYNKVPDTPHLFEMTGKSGQRYKFAVTVDVRNDYITTYCNTFLYIVTHSRYDIMYYTISLDDNKNIFDRSPEGIHINRFTHHVVHRYVERVGGNHYGELGFIEMNLLNLFIDPIEDDAGNLIAVTEQGSFVGKIIGGKQCFNTFYTDSITNDHRTMRNALKSSDIRDEAAYQRIKNNINSVISLYKSNAITSQQLISSIDTELKNADNGFYTFVGHTSETFRHHIGMLISSNSLCPSKTPRNTHLQGRKDKLRLEPCVQRTSYSVQNDEANIFRNYEGSGLFKGGTHFQQSR